MGDLEDLEEQVKLFPVDFCLHIGLHSSTGGKECKRMSVVDKRSPCFSSSFLRVIDLLMVQASRGLNQGNSVYHLAERFSLM